MKMGVHKEVDWAYLGALLAQEDDRHQSEFFKSFVKECKSWGTNHQVELQMASINSTLTADEKAALSMLSYEDQ